MNGEHDMNRRTGTRRAPIVVAALAGLAIAGSIAVPAHADDGEQPVLRPMLCAKEGVCLAYTALLADSDHDGVADIDEEAAGTSADDWWSAPKVDELTAVIGKGVLPSFELGFSEVIVLPETFPDGTPLIEDVTSAVAGRTSALARMGVADKLLAQYGLDLASGVVLDQAAGAIGMRLDKDGRPVREGDAPVEKRVGGIAIGLISDGADGGTGGEKGDGAPVVVPFGFGSDRNGGADTGKGFVQGFIDMFTPKPDKPDKPDAGTPKSMSTGDEGNVVLPLGPEDMERVIVKLNTTTKPVNGDPKVDPDIAGVDLNPRRTIILTDDPVESRLTADILKIVLTEPDPQDPSVRDTNFGPNGGIVPAVEEGSGFPKP
ncbi:hypothetical protein [Microbacterium jejuense]|uniref:hypothetical protein n=1 Tax=Microbacterium jejuense TaxID=1263637 RepID=UPI0031E73ACE